jgi:hypothetical protein
MMDLTLFYIFMAPQRLSKFDSKYPGYLPLTHPTKVEPPFAQLAVEMTLEELLFFYSLQATTLFQKEDNASDDDGDLRFISFFADFVFII